MSTKNKCYYHITSFEGWLAIKTHGIRPSEDGYIYVLDDKDVVSYVAFSQLLKGDYGLYEIDIKGITANLEPDEVGELTAKHQFRVKQAVILPKYLKDLGMHKVIPPTFEPGVVENKDD
jgi:hypothetical protein